MSTAVKSPQQSSPRDIDAIERRMAEPRPNRGGTEEELVRDAKAVHALVSDTWEKVMEEPAFVRMMHEWQDRCVEKGLGPHGDSIRIFITWLWFNTNLVDVHARADAEVLMKYVHELEAENARLRRAA